MGLSLRLCTGGGCVCVCQKKQDQVLSVNLSDAQLLNGRGLSSLFFLLLEKVYQQEIPQTPCSFPINSTPGEVRESFDIS